VGYNAVWSVESQPAVDEYVPSIFIVEEQTNQEISMKREANCLLFNPEWIVMFLRNVIGFQQTTWRYIPEHITLQAFP
jgi:hypothetical protein